MVIHIQIFARVTKVNKSEDDEFTRGSHLTKILNQQTVSDRNRNLVQFLLDELMKRAEMLYSGAMTEGS